MLTSWCHAESCAACATRPHVGPTAVRLYKALLVNYEHADGHLHRGGASEGMMELGAQLRLQLRWGTRKPTYLSMRPKVGSAAWIEPVGNSGKCRVCKSGGRTDFKPAQADHSLYMPADRCTVCRVVAGELWTAAAAHDLRSQRAMGGMDVMEKRHKAVLCVECCKLCTGGTCGTCPTPALGDEVLRLLLGQAAAVRKDAGPASGDPEDWPADWWLDILVLTDIEVHDAVEFDDVEPLPLAAMFHDDEEEAAAADGRTAPST